MDRQERACEIMRRLGELYPEAHIALDYTTPFALLVAVILSAQTTDAGVNKVTPVLFSRFPTPEALASADVLEVEEIVRPTGFYHNKTKLIIGTARMLVSEFGGRVPDTMEDLMRLPGVARKTANIVVANAYGKVEGIAVDTHVFRLAHRFGLSEQKDPDKVERDLMEVIPRDEWFAVNYRFIDHGRAVCTAKRPVCGACTLNDICPAAFTTPGWRESL
ncbi:MAG: endonuclease III [Actinobacteria bacterium HGW-Actinobacteria-1]|jgi:endonuclease-3|nr:MAG: endonuclease III [Actinobacteria bacterium HGW-Actinobacteria-1]